METSSVFREQISNSIGSHYLLSRTTSGTVNPLNVTYVTY